jgi:hypothetical protein
MRRLLQIKAEWKNTINDGSIYGSIFLFL